MYAEFKLAMEAVMSRLAVVLGILATPAFADPEGYGHMMDWGYGYGIGMMFGPVLWLVVLGLVVAGVIWLVRRLDGETSHKQASSAVAELDMRLARGEIEIDEYTSRKKALSS
ncbi:MAG: hypothetical protein NXH83_13535 [Rhodobacteraceae bacterium]|nr:hypothetical protein [Paracoccaceae bacterium]